MENVQKVTTSVEFRDVVMKLAADGHQVYAKLADQGLPFYAINARPSAFDRITLEDLFQGDRPPLYMEDFAQAMIHAVKEGKNVEVEVFTL